MKVDGCFAKVAVLVALLIGDISFSSDMRTDGAKDETQTYVLAANDNYIDALKVALYSLVKHTIGRVHVIVMTPQLNKENISVISRVMKAAAAKRQRNTQKLESLSVQIFQYNRQRIHCQGAEDTDGINGKKLFINAKISLIKNLTQKLLKGYENIQHFMWLDSDILIRGNITQLYQQCCKNKGIAVASSNLFFVRGDLSNASPSASSWFSVKFRRSRPIYCSYQARGGRSL